MKQILVITTGFEPVTVCLEGRCSIQLSYVTIPQKKYFRNASYLGAFMKYLFILSGRQDSNLRPPGPKPGAMTGLRYAPNYQLFNAAERLGLEPRRRLPADRLAICSVTTPAPLLSILANSLSSHLRVQRYSNFFNLPNFLLTFLYFFLMFLLTH